MMVNFFVLIKPNIYYQIEYTVNVSNENELIDEVELFNYSHFLDCSNDYYTCEIKKCFIDRESINCFKKKINHDIGFHFDPNYHHYFKYYFKANQYNDIYITYNNNTLFNCTYYNNTQIFTIITEIWYLNFSIIPYVFNNNDTILLSNLTIVEIDFYYAYKSDFQSLVFFQLKQYLFLDDDLRVILICIPLLITAP